MIIKAQLRLCKNCRSLSLPALFSRELQSRYCRCTNYAGHTLLWASSTSQPQSLSCESQQPRVCIEIAGTGVVKLLRTAVRALSLLEPLERISLQVLGTQAKTPTMVPLQ
jgi:hypothetical protein